ncbi:MAG TPA: glycosyltransferase family 2 protein, partial [Chryseosolibacter sp.]|nr:glycosyltransferase family 2 protein [Chryseosolibacter sp.]
MSTRPDDIDKERILAEAPVIGKVPDGVARPQWSVMIPVYNCAKFLPETLNSVLAAGLPEGRMQIAVVDDCSVDSDVRELVDRIGNDRIEYFRQKENVGSLRNFHTCLERSRGHLIHLLHGDDVVRPGFYEKVEALFDRFPAAGAAFCRYEYIDEASRVMYKQ